jgi:hypothetical protein
VEMRGAYPGLGLPRFPAPLREKPLRFHDARRTMGLLWERLAG